MPKENGLPSVFDRRQAAWIVESIFICHPWADDVDIH